MKRKKLLKRLSSGNLKNVAFRDMEKLVEGFGFRLSRVAGSHHIYYHSDITEMVNLQEVKGETKPYQIRQFLKIVERYNMKLED